MSDLLVTNARIWRGLGVSDTSTALVTDGVFAFVGEPSDVNPPIGVARLDAGGRRIVPGFTDAHAHMLATGLAMQSVDLKGAPTVSEAVQRVKARAATLPAGTWITGAGWDQHLWSGQRFPSREDLDAVTPDHPVSLTHTSGHCSWVNTAALRAAGITSATTAPEGGSIEHATDGEPSGILLDNASKLVSAAMPGATQTERLTALRSAVSHAHSLGITSVHAMNIGRGEFQAFHALHDGRALTLRTRMFLAHDRLDEWIERNLATGDGDEMLRIGGVKFFSDGALGSLTAWMNEPYASTGGCGFPLQPVDDLERDVLRSLAQGLAPAIHAIGDRANHEVLDLLERCRTTSPALPRRVEHAQLLDAGDIGRFAELGVTVSAQPIHATQDWQKVDREWGSRGAGAYAFGSLQQTGANLAFGSDTPVETMDPLAGVHAAVTRRTADGRPSEGWYPGECITVHEALHYYTAGAARAVGEDHALGRIAPGYAADFVVLSGDIFTHQPEGILQTRVDATYVAGARVFLRETPAT